MTRCVACRLGLTTGEIDLVVCTHAHPDHMEAISMFDRAETLFALHEADWELVKDMGWSAPEFFLKEGDLRVGDVSLDVFHTPGHAPGAVTLYWSAENALFTGDLIFKDGLGRTDLPGGDGSQLKESIRRMGRLNAQWLLSGHGEVVHGADAVRENFERVEHVWFQYI